MIRQFTSPTRFINTCIHVCMYSISHTSHTTSCLSNEKEIWKIVLVSLIVLSYCQNLQTATPRAILALILLVVGGACWFSKHIKLPNSTFFRFLSCQICSASDYDDDDDRTLPPSSAGFTSPDLKSPFSPQVLRHIRLKRNALAVYVCAYLLS